MNRDTISGILTDNDSTASYQIHIPLLHDIIRFRILTDVSDYLPNTHALRLHGQTALRLHKDFPHG